MLTQITHVCIEFSGIMNLTRMLVVTLVNYGHEFHWFVVRLLLAPFPFDSLLLVVVYFLN